MKPRKDLVVESVDGEVIVLDMRNGKVHKLNPSATLVWGGLNDGLPTNEIVDSVFRHFDVELDQAESDVRAVIAQFAEIGLLEE